jgi:glycosyltransferase involved in cell wall biosynthesis
VVDIDLADDDADPQRLDAAAQRILNVLASNKPEAPPAPACTLRRRPRLAFVSPLPPVQSGISDYSAELLPELARHYRIDLVVDQPEVGGPWVEANGPTRSVDWLRANAHRIDRVVYQVGNALFHRHMLPLLEEVPGVVVLHDLYLTSMLAHLELTGEEPGVWTHALFNSHGYSAFQARFTAQDVHEVVARYPGNRQVLHNARRVILHSQSAKRELDAWYEGHSPIPVSVVPMPRARPTSVDRAEARTALDLPKDAFVVCSFGRIGATKLSRDLLSAWLHARLAADASCILVFVGSAPGDYGRGLIDMIAKSDARERVRVTEWVDETAFRNYLAAADLAVQLRGRSVGETSAAALDCLNYGIPTIVNGVGAMAELPGDTVWRLPAIVSESALTLALETLWQNPDRARAMGERARQYVHQKHGPRVCAQRYVEVIEDCYAGADVVEDQLLSALVDVDGLDLSGADGVALARAVARFIPGPGVPRQWLLDVSATSRSTLHSGIERVARALVLALIRHPPAGVRIEPVYLVHEQDAWQLRYARRFTCGLLECPTDLLDDAIVEPGSGDLLIHLDLHAEMLTAAHEAGVYRRLRDHGVAVYATVFDLLPVSLPQHFPPGTDRRHGRWLEAVADFDGAICISKAVAEDLRDWCHAHTSGSESAPLRIGWFHLGADLHRASPTRGLPADAETQIARMDERPTFLMVNTIEPRKGHLQTLAAFESLWQAGIEVGLVLVGQEGWRSVPEDQRRTIPAIVQRLRAHPQAGGRLLWLDGISDEYLERLYAAAACLINASEGEGFGLPLVEAAERGLPIIARDLPVFREVVGDGAHFFSGSEPVAIADAVRAWLANHANGRRGAVNARGIGTWDESAAVITAMLASARHPNWLEQNLRAASERPGGSESSPS